MFGKKSERIYDERIEKESNKPAAMMFYVTTVLLMICLGTKLAYQMPIQVYILELCCLFISLIYVIAHKAKNGILWMKEKDEVLVAINNRILSRAYMIDFWLLSFGELVFILVVKDYFWWVLMYFFTLLVPAFVISVLSIKKGWLVWGTKKQEQKGIKEFRKRTVIGSVFFGLFVGFPELYNDGVFHPEGILWVVSISVAWGAMFYVMMLAVIKASEKKADKLAEEAQNEVNNIEE